jgi:hypothetical protein
MLLENTGYFTRKKKQSEYSLRNSLLALNIFYNFSWKGTLRENSVLFTNAFAFCEHLSNSRDIFLKDWCHRLQNICYSHASNIRLCQNQIKTVSSPLYFPVRVENIPLGLSDRLPAMLNRLFGLKTARFPP